MSKKLLLDTKIPDNTDTKVLEAFLHGHVSGKITLYKKMDDHFLSIQFEEPVDATNFEIKGLSDIYLEEFHRKRKKDSTFPSMEDAILRNMRFGK